MIGTISQVKPFQRLQKYLINDLQPEQKDE